MWTPTRSWKIRVIYFFSGPTICSPTFHPTDSRSSLPPYSRLHILHTQHPRDALPAALPALRGAPPSPLMAMAAVEQVPRFVDTIA